MAKPDDLPTWDSNETNTIEPDSSRQTGGWLAPGGVPERPSFQYFNWWMNNVYKWINFVDDELASDGMADSLHRHSELSASDGSPDAVVAVNAIGEVDISGSVSNTTSRLLSIDQEYINTDSGTDYTTALEITKNSYNIASGVASGGYQVALNSSSFVSDSDFEGSLVNQYAIWARSGISVGTGTITNVYGVYVDGISSAGTITNHYGVYQKGNNTKNYFEGDVGIGDSSPSYQLELSTDSAGKPGAAGLWTVVSGKEIKEEIKNADLDLCYENFKKAKLKRYRYRDDCYSDEQIKDRNVLGFIADDVEEVFPKSVNDKKFIKQAEESEEIEIQEEINDNGEVTQERITEKKILKEEVSVHTKDLNNDQMLMNMFGTVAKLQEMVEELQKELKKK